MPSNIGHGLCRICVEAALSRKAVLVGMHVI